MTPGKCTSVELKITKELNIVNLLIQGYFTTGDLSTYQEITGNALTKHHCDAALFPSQSCQIRASSLGNVRLLTSLFCTVYMHDLGIDV